jgi:putative hydrolase of the HAD superfamily
MVAAVLFDLYETLVTETGIRPTRASSLAAALGVEREAYRREWKARRPRIVTGELSFGDALTDICLELTTTVNKAAITDIRDQRIREKADVFRRADERIIALVRALARGGVKLGVISNGFREDVLPWSGSSLAPLFTSTVFSCHEHVAKPDVGIYARALEELGVRPAETVYVGDGGDNELRGATQAGLRAFRATWFVRNPTCTGSWPELARPEDVLPIAWSG